MALHEVTSWTLQHPDIVFSSAVLFASGDRIIEAGRIIGKNFKTLPLFREAPHHCDLFGKPLWYRNVSAVSPIFSTFRRNAWHLKSYLALPWPKAFSACCIDAAKEGRRGIVTGQARIYLDKVPVEVLPNWHESFQADPYFHPGFDAVMPIKLSV